MALTNHSPAWHLRFGLESFGGDPGKFNGEATGSRFKQIVGPEWEWRLYRKALKQRELWLGQPRIFEAVQCVQPGASDKTVLEGLALQMNNFGAPVVHGESIKGACRSAVAMLMANNQDLDEALRHLFGTNDSEGESVFEDAWWVPSTPGQLESPFYLEIEAKTESKTLVGSTQPISRLAACGRFAFWLAKRSDRDPASSPWHDAAAWAGLEAALKHFGVGSRRNVDAYGRMTKSTAPP